MSEGWALVGEQHNTALCPHSVVVSHWSASAVAGVGMINSQGLCRSHLAAPLLQGGWTPWVPGVAVPHSELLGAGMLCPSCMACGADFLYQSCQLPQEVAQGVHGGWADDH